MTKIFEKIRQNLLEAIAYAERKPTPRVRIHTALSPMLTPKLLQRRTKQREDTKLIELAKKRLSTCDDIVIVDIDKI